MPEPAILITVQIELRGVEVSREQARELAQQLRKTTLMNALSQMEQKGLDPGMVEEMLTVFAPTITFPMPLKVSSG